MGYKGERKWSRGEENLGVPAAWVWLSRSFALSNHGGFLISLAPWCFLGVSVGMGVVGVAVVVMVRMIVSWLAVWDGYGFGGG